MNSHKKEVKIIEKEEEVLEKIQSECECDSKAGSIISPEDAIKLAQKRCLLRYRESRRKYNEYFLKCLDDIEALQPNAFSSVQVSRMFTVGVLPKYCKIKDPLTRKQRERVEQIIQG